MGNAFFKSLSRAGHGEDEMTAEVAGEAQAQLMQLIPLFEETKQYLRKVETWRWR